MSRFKSFIVYFQFVFFLASWPAWSNELNDNIKEYQEALIRSGVTGSSIAGVFSGSDTLALSAVSSGLPGDREVTEDTIFPIWSMSKPITVVAMMILLDKGAYKLDDPVKNHIPHFEEIMCKSQEQYGDPYLCGKDLLVEHLLTHRSGVGYNQLLGDFHSAEFRDPFSNLDEFVKHVASHPLEFEPGTQYLYGLNQAILGRLVEVLSGQEFYQFLKKEIFDRLGMKDTKFFLTDGDRERFQPLFRKAQDVLGIPGMRPDEGKSAISKSHDELKYTPGTKAQYGGEGLVSTFSDYRKFCEMMLARGGSGSATIISEESFELMTSVVTPHQLSGGYDNGFGYSFSLFSLQEPLLDGTGAPKGIFGWSGYHNTHFWIDPKNEVYGLFMTRTTPFTFEIQKQFRATVYNVL